MVSCFHAHRNLLRCRVAATPVSEDSFLLVLVKRPPLAIEEKKLNMLCSIIMSSRCQSISAEDASNIQNISHAALVGEENDDDEDAKEIHSRSHYVGY